MKQLKQQWLDRLTQHRDSGYWRLRKTVSHRCGTAITCDQKPMLNFSSNDYLNLATAPSVIQAFTEAASRYGVGSGASPAVSGYSEEQSYCEQALSSFFQVDKGCIFSSGYLGNLGIFSALFDANTRVYLDRYCHASIIDACRLAGVRLRRFRHNDVEHCRQLLEQDAHIDGPKVIVTEGVFSAQGDVAPLPALHQLAREQDCLFIVDDTHGIGVLGACGRGSLEHYGMPTRSADVVIGTFGKALGGAGGFVLCDEFIYDMLTQLSRTLMFNTALPPAVFAAMRESLRLIEDDAQRQHNLQENIKFLQQSLAAVEIDCLAHPAAIQVIPLGEAKLASLWQNACLNKQILVGMLRYPTVPKQQACLRISVTAGHTQQEISKLTHCLSEIKQHHDIEV